MIPDILKKGGEGAAPKFPRARDKLGRCRKPPSNLISVRSPQLRSLRLRALLLFQRGVDGGVGADFEVSAVGPALDGEILDIDSRHSAHAHHDLAEDVAIDRDGGTEQAVLAFIGRRDRMRQLYR